MVIFIGRGERAQTFDLSVPNRARYQLRHTPMVFNFDDYTPDDKVFPVLWLTCYDKGTL